MFSLRLCWSNAAVLLWYLAYLLQFQHLNLFRHSADSRGCGKSSCKAKVHGQTALFYAVREVRVEQIWCTLLPPCWVCFTGFVKQVRRRLHSFLDVYFGLFWPFLHLLAIVPLSTCLSPPMFVPDKGHIETVKYLITKGCDPNWVDNEGNTAQLGCFWVWGKGQCLVGCIQYTVNIYRPVQSCRIGPLPTLHLSAAIGCKS